MAMTQKSLNDEADEYSKAHAELDASDTQVAGLGDMIKKGAAAVGRTMLGAGTDTDSTADGRAYKLHKQESEAEGTKPMTQDEFKKSRGSKEQA